MTSLDRSALDDVRMEEALRLAETAVGVCDPNPRVGCIIGSADGEIFGRGATQAVGGPHAEAVALADAKARGHTVSGATAWVTLEPCAHHGRTPPCCDALIAAGLSRVVIALEDPFPAVCGAGTARMRQAGITVEFAAPSIAQAAWQLNIGFFSRVLRARPWVRVKSAISLDGRVALHNGQSQWITGEAARADGHAWRRRASAVLTGIGTALADDPRLDVRWVPTTLQPLRVVVDSRLRLPATARILAPPGRCIVVGAECADDKVAEMKRAGAEVWLLPGRDGRVDLPALLRQLAEHGVNELHVEAGAELSTAFLRDGLADELLVYVAPRLLGAGRGMLKGPALTDVRDSTDFEWVDVAQIGSDLRLRLRPVGTRFAQYLAPRGGVDGLYMLSGRRPSKSEANR